MLRLRQVGSNQTILVVDNAEILFSYETPVAVDTGEKILVTNEKFSVTTSKHINQYLDGRRAEKVSQSEIEQFLK